MTLVLLGDPGKNIMDNVCVSKNAINSSMSKYFVDKIKVAVISLFINNSRVTSWNGCTDERMTYEINDHYRP